MKLYECIVDDGKDVFKTKVSAKNKKDLLSVYGGNGDFISIKDITNDCFCDVSDYSAIEHSVEVLRETLLKAGYGESERIILCSLLGEFLDNRM